MDPVAWDQVQLWSLHDIHTWLDHTDMLDCLPILAQNNITSGQCLLRLKEETIMTWNLPLSQKRLILQLIHANARHSSKKETKIKGIFETLSRRRRPAPRPIPADYGHPVEQATIALPREEKQPPDSHCLIVVDRADIQARIPESGANDWGSEFSDSDTEIHPTPRTAKAPARTTMSCPIAASLTAQPHVPAVPFSTENDALYEEPERAIEGPEPTKVRPKMPIPPGSSTPRRSSQFLSVSDSPSEIPVPRAVTSRKSELQGLDYSVNAKEVAQKLNILLASHAAKHAAPTDVRRNSSHPGLSRPVSMPAFEQQPKRPPLMTSVSQQAYPPLDELDGYSWFHGDIGRAEANVKLENDQTDGAFLIRKCRKGASKFAASPYSLSLMSNGKVYHLTIRIRPQDGMYALGFEKPDELTFTSVKDLVEHHLIHPVYLTECDRGVLLSFV